MSTLSIIIPAYNEETGITEIAKRVLAVRERIVSQPSGIEDVELLVIDDGSRDRTAEIASAMPGVRVVRHRRNQGYGAALKTGFREARGELLAFLDADGTYPPEFLPALCGELVHRDADMVIGSRFGTESSQMPLQRKVGNKLFAYLLSWIVGYRVQDTASGMRVMKRESFERLLPLPDGLHFTPAMSTRALHEGMRVVEVAIPYSERVGRSKLNPATDGFRFLNIIVGTARLYNPLKFFGVVGLLMFAVALVLSIDPIAYYARTRRVEDTEIYRLFTIMVLFVTGLNVINFGAFANYVVEIVQERELRQHSFIGKYFMPRQVVRRSGIIGVLLILSAVLLNHRTIYEYLTTQKIYVHWSYVLTGATLFLVGVQLIMGSILISVLEELAGRRRFLQ